MRKKERISGRSLNSGVPFAFPIGGGPSLWVTVFVAFFLFAAMRAPANADDLPVPGDPRSVEAASEKSVVETSPGRVGRSSRPNYTRASVAYSVPEVELTAHDGTRVGLIAALGEDRSVMVNFVFTSCTTICPVLSASFAAVNRQLSEAGEDVEFLSISIDPEYDTRVKLAEYAKKVGAGGNWLFFTGSQEDILDLQTAFDTYRGNKMNHLPLTFLKRAGARNWTRLEGFPSVEEILMEYRSSETL